MGTEAGERIRSFIAVDLAVPVRAALRQFLADVAQVKCDVRWVRGEGLHVTLKFLGGVEPARLEQVRATLAAALSGRPALRVRARGLGAFPSWRRPRVLWVGLEGEGLPEMAACVETAMCRLGFEPEGRAFTPHITLGRVNGMRGWSLAEERLKTHLSDDFGVSIVEGVTIYRSVLRPDGAVYTPLWTIPLGRNMEGPQ
ncbi:MAG: 2'-5' ligase [Deltaproteobacteria bacterium]|nr:2'-5' ligase [Deltaproteobacteria bacterium]